MALQPTNFALGAPSGHFHGLAGDSARWGIRSGAPNRLGPVIIRQAAPADLSAINSVHYSSGRPAWDAEVLVDPDRFVAVAVLGEVIVGAGKTHFFSEPDDPAPQGHYLGGVTVHPDHRRLGIGRALTRARMDWVWSRSNRLYYFTDDHNAASILMHATLGFEEIARAPTLRQRRADRPTGNLILFQAVRPGPVDEQGREPGIGETRDVRFRRPADAVG